MADWVWWSSDRVKIEIFAVDGKFFSGILTSGVPLINLLNYY